MEQAAPVHAAPGPGLSARRWVWPTALLLAGVWAVALGALAWTRADEPTLNRVQFRRADALALVEILNPVGETPDGTTVAAMVVEAVPGGRGPAPEGLKPGTSLEIRGFPRGAAIAGTRAAAPVRRVREGWTVAETPESLPNLVYSLSNPGDWSDLKAAAAALSAGRAPYR